MLRSRSTASNGSSKQQDTLNTPTKRTSNKKDESFRERTLTSHMQEYNEIRILNVAALPQNSSMRLGKQSVSDKMHTHLIHTKPDALKGSVMLPSSAKDTLLKN